MSAPPYECTTGQPKQGIQSEHKVHNTGPQATAMLWSAAALLGWIISSSGLILLNKQLMVTDGFKFPMALTAAGQFTSYLGGELSAVCSLNLSSSFTPSACAHGCLPCL